MSEPSGEPEHRSFFSKATVDRWQVFGGMAGVMGLGLSVVSAVKNLVPLSMAASGVVALVGVFLTYRWGRKSGGQTIKGLLVPVVVTIVGATTAGFVGGIGLQSPDGKITTTAAVEPKIIEPAPGLKTDKTRVNVKVTAPPPENGRKWMIAVKTSRAQDGHCWFYQLMKESETSYTSQPGIGPENKANAKGFYTLYLVDIDGPGEQAIADQKKVDSVNLMNNGMPCPSGVRFLYGEVMVERP